MSLPISRLYELANKYLKGDLSAAELTELETMIDGSAELAKLFNEFMQVEYSLRGKCEMCDMELEAEWLIFAIQQNWKDD